MGFSKIPLFLACILIFEMALFINAQNSIQDYLDAHNAARSAVGVGPLTWDAEVASYAESYASQRSGDCSLIHSGTQKYGENIAAGGSSDGSLTGKAAVDLWVDEKQYYDHDSNSCNAPPGESCGHYTQVVWRNTEKVGCARVQCSNGGGYFVTCNYSPPGNYPDQSPY